MQIDLHEAVRQPLRLPNGGQNWKVYVWLDVYQFSCSWGRRFQKWHLKCNLTSARLYDGLINLQMEAKMEKFVYCLMYIDSQVFGVTDFKNCLLRAIWPPWGCMTASLASKWKVCIWFDVYMESQVFGITNFKNGLLSANWPTWGRKTAS